MLVVLLQLLAAPTRAQESLQEQLVWQQLRADFALRHYYHEPRVKREIERIKRNPNHLLVTSKRAEPYLFYILQQVRLRGMPADDDGERLQPPLRH